MKFIKTYILFLSIFSCDTKSTKVDLLSLIREGNSFYMAGDFDNALSLYNKVYNLDPKNAIAINNIGEVYEAKNQLDSAEIYFLKAVEIDGDNVFTIIWQNVMNLKIILKKPLRYLMKLF